MYDVIVIGAGAAGLMCAITAGSRGLSVLVIEHAEKPGKKILISGGGRCNFTNIHTSHSNFISGNPDFCRSALSRYKPDDFISLVKKHRISYHEKKLGQLFCTGSSRQIVEMLIKECNAAGVEIRCGESVTEITKPDLFTVSSSNGLYKSGNLVIASGGLSIPKIGATGFGYDIAGQFSHGIVPQKPGLVPLLLKQSQKKMFSAISGVSCDSVVSSSDVSFRENLLFTHRGLSGPAVLQLSSYLNNEDLIVADLLPGIDLAEHFIKNKNRRISLQNFLSEMIPHRLAEILISQEFSQKTLNNISNSDLRQLSNLVKQFTFYISGNEGFEKAEVTCGGVDTRQLSSKSMESQLVKGLYFIGEVVDVTGWLGGYNFQWAWSSGHAAGSSISN